MTRPSMTRRRRRFSDKVSISNFEVCNPSLRLSYENRDLSNVKIEI